MAYSETRYAYVRDDKVAAWVAPAVLAALGAIAIGAFVLAPPPSFAPLTSAHVKVVVKDGHGSATHIGDGLYVTAAHVVGDQAEVDINGQSYAVLWSNTEYDIAMVSGPKLAASVPLWCGVAEVGSDGVAHGNPTSFTDISLTGKVAGEAREIGQWRLAIPVDVSMAPGMSGGGWVSGGSLAGVNVGVAVAPTGLLGGSFFGLAIVVPSSVVCDLMGRS